MTIDKILVIDDKNARDAHSTANLMRNLDSEQRSYVEFYNSTSKLWIESKNGDDLQLLIDFSMYSLVIIHDSYDDPLVHDGLLPVLIQKLSSTSNVVLLSGSKEEKRNPIAVFADQSISPGVSYYEVIRRQYFRNFPNLIDSKILFKEFRLEYLYDYNGNPKQDLGLELLESIKVQMEISTSSAIDSDVLSRFLNVFCKEDIQSFKRKLNQMRDDEFIYAIELLIDN